MVNTSSISGKYMLIPTCMHPAYTADKRVMSDYDCRGYFPYIIGLLTEY